MSHHKKSAAKLSEENLETLSREELLAKIRKLIAHNTQLKNVLNKKIGEEETTEPKRGRPFDFSKYSTRHIFLKVLYLGWNFQGFSRQEDGSVTVECMLLDALKKSCLVGDLSNVSFQCCGRTDKGVSAFGQVVSLNIRSRVGNTAERNDFTDDEMDDASVLSPTFQTVADGNDVQGELEYCKILNRLLPHSIRVIAWSPVSPQKSARFSCKKRTYKYLFPRGALNLQSIMEAANYLVGEHDFRNFCKMDVGNGVLNYNRKIFDISLSILQNDGLLKNMEVENSAPTYCIDHIEESMPFEQLQKTSESTGTVENTYDHPTEEEEITMNENELSTPSVDMVSVKQTFCDHENTYTQNSFEANVGVENLQNNGSAVPKTKTSPYDMCELTIVGQSFLWHQIRCIVSVLFLVGEGKEDPKVVKDLLDVEAYPRKPQYGLAAEYPLNLFATEYDSSLQWIYDKNTVDLVVKALQREWTELAIRSSMVRRMLSDLEVDDDINGSEVNNCLLQQVRPRTYIPLLQRQTCESLENRIQHYAKRQRLEEVKNCNN